MKCGTQVLAHATPIHIRGRIKMNKDFLNILREIVGSGKPGTVKTDGIWYELTQADKNGNLGIYGDILAKAAAIEEGAPTLEQALQILNNLNLEVTTLEADEEATSTLDENGVWQVGIPKGKDGINGNNGLTSVPTLSYNAETGDIEFDVAYIDLATEEEW